MVKLEIYHLIFGLSLVHGISLFVASSIFLDESKEVHDTCRIGELYCNQLHSLVIQGWFGITAAVIQTLAFILAIGNWWKIWSVLHVVVSLITTVLFMNAGQLFDHSLNKDKERILNSSKGRAFVIINPMDGVFSIFGAIAILIISRKQNTSRLHF